MIGTTNAANSACLAWRRRCFDFSLRGRITALALASASWFVTDAHAQASKTEREARTAWFRDAKFGMQIQWGLFSIPAGEWKGKKYPQPAESLMFNAQIPVDEYEPLARRFNPVKFDADRWVQLAKSAGANYLIVPAKHHDGFCMYESKLTDFDVVESTPFRRDVLKEIADACRKHSLRWGFSYSMMDWRHPDYLPRGPKSQRPWDRRPTDGAGYDRYLDYVKGQLRELLTNYGTVDVLWFDGGWEHSAAEHRADEIVRFVRGLQPNIVVNDRLMAQQDFATYKQRVPANISTTGVWELAVGLNDSGGYRRDDRNWKTSKDLLRTLVEVASKGGNLLLSVGPTAEGEIPAECGRRLEAIGQWMELNGESVYRTQAGPFRFLFWGRCTQKPGTLYLHVFDWPKRILELPGLRNAVTEAYLLGDEQKTRMPVARQDNDVLIRLPDKAPDTLDSVIVVKILGPPDVYAPTPKGSPNRN